MVILDVECYQNYFLAAFIHIDTHDVIRVGMLDDSKLDAAKIRRIMKKYTTISFNGNGYDLYMIAYALRGATNKDLKALSDEIIKSNLPSYRVAQQFGVHVPDDWDHIDIIDVAPGQASLKIYSGRMHEPKMQDLPIPVTSVLTDDQAAYVADYCVNDLKVTLSLYRMLEPAIDLRVSMSEQYGTDLRSKSDAQIAELVIGRELERLTGVKPSRPEVPDGTTFRYLDPGVIEFQTPEMQEVLDLVLNTEFELGLNGAVKIPDALKWHTIEIGNTQYQMGIGGLHSMESQQMVRRGKGEVLADYDVASYYPSIILQQKLAPDSMGKPFLKVYQDLVTRRLEAKAAGDKVTADTLKIVINGSFGKLGSKWSTLYAPELMIQTTITGQLGLLMLIEAFELAGVPVISANTDGVVVHTTATKEGVLDEVTFDWMMRTSWELERTNYELIASRDVNNYMAIKPDGSIKGKGLFTSPGLAKNPDRRIVSEAVMAYLKDGTPLEDTITQCRDITKFVIVRKVTGGALWRDEPLGRAVRYYTSAVVPESEGIVYQKSGNLVPKSSGSRPLMDLPDEFPNDVDYRVYIEAAEKLLVEVGYR